MTSLPQRRASHLDGRGREDELDGRFSSPFEASQAKAWTGGGAVIARWFGLGVNNLILVG